MYIKRCLWEIAWLTDCGFELKEFLSFLLLRTYRAYFTKKAKSPNLTCAVLGLLKLSWVFT
jgi:hypothetical protein